MSDAPSTSRPRPRAGDPGVVLGFPGQAVDVDVVCRTLARHRRDPLVAALARACEVDDWRLVSLRERSVMQPAIVVAGVVRARRVSGQASLVVGHSLGEITALVVAGAVDEEAGLHMAMARERICNEAALRSPGDMVAVLGLPEHAVERLRRQIVADTQEILDIAAVNRPEQIVLSGARRATAKVARLAQALGGYSVRLPIDGPYHSSLMQAAVRPLERVVAQIDVREPAVDWMSTIDGQVHTDPDEIRTCVLDALVMPVRWARALSDIVAAGYSTMIDVGPGDALSRLHDQPGLRLQSCGS